MGKIRDYLLWRGDLHFSQDPFNDIDALIFALLSYLPFKGIVPRIESNKDISLKAASFHYFSKDSNTEEETSNLTPSASETFDSELEKLLYQAANCPRFEEVRLSKYDDNTDFVVGRQFGAVTFTLDTPGHKKVVAFRGTNNSLIGWKEDFQLAYLEQTPAQKSAKIYLDHTIGIFSNKIIVCGHSKGGNLALYAGLNVNSARQSKISKIINFDGPGFDFSVNDRASFLHNEDKVINYLPEESVVGMLLEPVGKRNIISSSARFMNQHNAFNWGVEQTNFIPEKLSNTAIFIDQTIKTWLAEISLPEREIFIEALFDILGASEGAVILPAAQEKLKDINKVLVKYSNLDNKTKSLLTQLFVLLTTQLTNQTKINLTTTMKEILPKKNQ